MPLDIHLFGSLEILRDGEPHPILRSPKGCALLAYLIVSGGDQARESVADLLWDARSSAASLRNLRVLLTRTRGDLPELQSGNGNLAFAAGPGDRLDYLDLVRTLEAGEPAISDLRVYRGDLMEGFYLDGAPRFQEWLTLERERMRRAVLNAYDELCERCAEAKDWAAGAAAAESWLALDDLDEIACLWLLRFLAAEGEAGRAMEVYRDFSARLGAEIGVDPGGDLQRFAATWRGPTARLRLNCFPGWISITTWRGRPGMRWRLPDHCRPTPSCLSAATPTSPAGPHRCSGWRKGSCRGPMRPRCRIRRWPS
jgi:DNA-binding SARP family transcriptional activator